MRPPWLQIETDFIEVTAPDLAVLLEAPGVAVSEGDAGWGAQKVFLWMLERCPPDEPPSAHDTLSGPAAARLLARAAGYRGPPEQLVAAYVEKGLLELLGDGPFRLRGLRRYDEAWAKNDKDRAARWAITHPEWALAHRYTDARRGTAAEPPRKPGGPEGQDPRSKIQDPSVPSSVDPPPVETASLWEAMQVQREEKGLDREARPPKKFRDWHLELRGAGHDDDQALRGHWKFLRDETIRAKGHPTTVFISAEVWALRIPPPRRRLETHGPPVVPPRADLRASGVWQQLLADLTGLGKPYAREWLEKLVPVALEARDDHRPDVLTLEAADQFYAAWVADYYGPLVEQLGRERALTVQVRAPGPDPPAPFAALEQQEDERHRTTAEVLQLVREVAGGT